MQRCVLMRSATTLVYNASVNISMDIHASLLCQLLDATSEILKAINSFWSYKILFRLAFIAKAQYMNLGYGVRKLHWRKGNTVSEKIQHPFLYTNDVFITDTSCCVISPSSSHASSRMGSSQCLGQGSLCCFGGCCLAVPIALQSQLSDLKNTEWLSRGLGSIVHC